jgi:hypothetical protein
MKLSLLFRPVCCRYICENLSVVNKQEIGQTNLRISTPSYLDQIRDHPFILSHLCELLSSASPKNKGLKRLLLEKLASLPTKNASCDVEGCPIWWRSHFNLGTTLGMIGNVSSSTGILILQGENDTSTPVQQAFLLQKRLTDVNHPDHTLITYPGLGHDLSPAIGIYPGSSMYGLQKSGPIEDYALADLTLADRM